MPREISVAEFVAESLEADAARTPSGMKGQADGLRKAAQNYRQFGSKRNVRIWEENDWNKSDFIRPDPASH